MAVKEADLIYDSPCCGEKLYAFWKQLFEICVVVTTDLADVNHMFFELFEKSGCCLPFAGSFLTTLYFTAPNIGRVSGLYFESNITIFSSNFGVWFGRCMPFVCKGVPHPMCGSAISRVFLGQPLLGQLDSEVTTST